MDTTSASSIHTIEGQTLGGTCQLTMAAHGVMDVLSLSPFHILICSFPAKVMHLSMLMIVAYATRRPTSVVTASSTWTSNRSPQSLVHSVLCDEHSANCKAEQNTALSKALQAEHENIHKLVAAVHYRPRTDRELQIDKHVRQKQDATAQLKKHCKEEVVNLWTI